MGGLPWSLDAPMRLVHMLANFSRTNMSCMSAQFDCRHRRHLALAITFLVLAILVPGPRAFFHARVPRRRTSPRSPLKGTGQPNAQALELKQKLLESVLRLQKAQERDGAVKVDVELNATTRAPQKVNFYAVSEDVGQAADQVMAYCDELSQYNPTSNATSLLGDRQNGSRAPLHGPWKLIFTTAADAAFPKNSTSRRPAAQAQNIVDGPLGRITNVIDFLSPTGNSTRQPLLKQLNVVIKARAVSPSRVELQFRYAKVVFSRFFFLPFQWTLFIPVPSIFITRCLVLFYRIFRRGSAKAPPKAYFDVLYLDEDLRIHKTGEDNWFVQARPSWKDAQNLMI